MAPNVIRPNQMLIFNSAMCYVDQRQLAAAESGSPSTPSSVSPPAKRTYVKNISPEEKILRKKLRNREAAQLSRDKKKAQFNVLSRMVHGLRKENVDLREEIETLRSNQEQLMAENERLREQLSAESSSIPKSVVTEFCTTAANNKISIDGPAVSNRHPLQKGKRNRKSCLTLCYQILILLLTIPSYTISSFQTTKKVWTGLTAKYSSVWRKLLMNYSANFLNECSPDGEMVGSTSEVMEPSYNIDLPYADINNDIDVDDQLCMLKTDTDTVKISAEEMHCVVPKVEIKTEIEEQSDDESNSLERFIIVEEAVEEVTTTYDEHILEMCQEDDSMDTDQYEDIGYESLSSPEYEYKTHYIIP